LKQSILEIAIITDNRKQILDVWPQVNLKECSFPFEVHYMVEELDDQNRIFIYLFELENAGHLEPMEKLIPFLPFCLMFVDELDESFVKKISDYTSRFETPLYLVMYEDEELKEKISTIAHLDFKLPEFVILEKQATVSRTIRKLVKNILDKVILHIAAEGKPEPPEDS